MITDDLVYFSIIIPTYNRAWCIERAMKSVLAQDFRDWEMIIVDDGSTDNTKDIVEEYLSDSRIRYFYKENGGVGSARNLGMEQASGRYLMFLDSDDEFVANALNIIQIAVSKYEDAKMFSFRAVDERGKQISYTDKIFGDRRIDFVDFISQRYIKGEAFLVYKKTIFEGNKFDEDVNGGEGLLLLGLIRDSGLMLINSDARIYHTESPDSIISSKLTPEKMRNIHDIQTRLIKKYEAELKVCNREYLGTAYLVLARSTALSGERIKSLREFFLGCWYNSTDIRSIILYAVSLLDYNMKMNNFLNSIRNKYHV